MKKIALILLAAFSIFLTSCSLKPSGGGKALLKVNSTELKNTKVTAHLEQEIAGDKNILYCSTFQMAWNELIDNIIKDGIKLAENPDTALKLNKRLSDKDDVSEKDYLAMSGYGKDNIVDKINKALRDKFGTDAPKVEEQLAPTDIMAYSFLYKNLEFKKEFESLKDPVNFDGQNVKAFGITKNNDKTKDIAEQVQVVDYNSPDDFIIKLQSKSENDEIILAKVNPERDLLSTYEKIDKRVKDGKPSGLQQDERLAIPKFDFDITHDYGELTGKHLLNKGFEDYFIRMAQQNTKFKLDEKGAVLKSEAKIVITKSAPREGRSFIFNKPFAFILREKGANMPYFVLWVDNTELMVR